MTLDDIVSKLDLSDIRYSADGKTLRPQLIPYFKKLYPDADIQLPSWWVDGGLPPMTPDDFARDEQIQKLRIAQFKASGGTYTYPESYSYEFEIGRWHNQVRSGHDEGTCYTECTTGYAEWWLWMQTGQKIDISDNELRDVAGDSKGLGSGRTISGIEGGYPQKSLPAIYHFNENISKHKWFSGESAACKKFKELVDTNMGGFSMRKPVSTSPADMKEHLFRYGPCTFTYDGHATLYCAYDSSKVYWRDSYVERWHDLRSMTWDDYARRGRSLDEHVALIKPFQKV